MKKTWVRKTLSVGILAAGALLLAPSAAALAAPAPVVPDLGVGGLTGSLGSLTGGLPVVGGLTDVCGPVLGVVGSPVGLCAAQGDQGGQSGQGSQGGNADAGFGSFDGSPVLESRALKPSVKQATKRAKTNTHDKKRIESGSCGGSYGILGYASTFSPCSSVGRVVVHRKRTLVKRIVPVYTPGYLIGGNDCGDWNYRATALYGMVVDNYGGCGDGWDDGYLGGGYLGAGYLGGGCGITICDSNPVGVGYGNVGTATPVGYANVGNPGGAYNTGTPGAAYNTGTPGGAYNTGTPNGAYNTGNPGTPGGAYNAGNPGTPGGAYNTGTPGNTNTATCNCGDSKPAKKPVKKPAKKVKNVGSGPVSGNPSGYDDVDDAGYQNGGNRGNAPANVDDGYGTQAGDAYGNTTVGGRGGR